MAVRKMTPAQFTAAREKFGLSKTDAAVVFGMSSDGRQAIRLWEAGRNKAGIPGPAQELMRAFIAGYRPKGVTFPNDKVKVK